MKCNFKSFNFKQIATNSTPSFELTKGVARPTLGWAIEEYFLIFPQSTIFSHFSSTFLLFSSISCREVPTLATPLELTSLGLLLAPVGLCENKNTTINLLSEANETSWTKIKNLSS